jgi:MutS domain III.
MSFVIDKQTLDDLNILGKYKSNSVYRIYNNTITEGGELILEKMFRSPMNNKEEIECRSAKFREFINKPIDFPFSKDIIESVENYMNTPVGNSKFADIAKIAKKKAMVYIAADEHYSNLKKGLVNVKELFKNLKDVLICLRNDYKSMLSSCSKIEKLLQEINIESYNIPDNYSEINFWKLEKLHYFLRVEKMDKVRELLLFIYELDVLLSVSKISIVRNFNCATIIDEKVNNQIIFKNLFHPAVRNAKANSVEVDTEKMFCF